MTYTRNRKIILFAAMAGLLIAVGMLQSWSLSLAIVNLCIISAVMSLGVNMQWGYAGLFNAGIMGFAALGGLAAIIVAMPPVGATWAVGWSGLLISFLIVVVTIFASVFVYKQAGLDPTIRGLVVGAIVVVGIFAIRAFFLPATTAIELVEPAKTGYLGGLGLPIILAWPIGGLLAAGAAWVVGRVALGLRADYLAIATLGISEIIVAIMKNEDWLTRGVKNVNGLPRPTPYEVDLQKTPWFVEWANDWGMTAIEASSIFVKLCYAGLFLTVLLIVLFLSERALKSPWGRMMRAIRDNEDAAEAMGKDVKGRHLEVFILGSAVIGIAGAMLTTLDGQFTPVSYQPLRFTFLIWVMVIVGGSGNNFGAVLGGFLIWFAWIEAEPVGNWLIDVLTSGMAADNALRLHLLDSAIYMRPITMGLVLLLVLRFSPRGLIPEESGGSGPRRG
ncbi:MAG: branched-chain amino acid ABC transporter permease [Pseudomonadota bacterium]